MANWLACRWPLLSITAISNNLCSVITLGFRRPTAGRMVTQTQNPTNKHLLVTHRLPLGRFWVFPSQENAYANNIPIPRRPGRPALPALGLCWGGSKSEMCHPPRRGVYWVSRWRTARTRISFLFSKCLLERIWWSLCESGVSVCFWGKGVVVTALPLLSCFCDFNEQACLLSWGVACNQSRSFLAVWSLVGHLDLIMVIVFPPKFQRPLPNSKPLGPVLILTLKKTTTSDDVDVL